ncbi:MAG: DNA recombination protein RmuC [Bacteroidetes bacterium]|nr:DNA recombination protein RmuC [Bacteroidota bacterium]MCL1969464.1 DNA recombination protein RmuC [Bacteroidota bacterium]
MEIIYLISGFVTGILFSYLVFYLSHKSKNVSKKEFEALNTKFNETVNAAKLNEERASAASLLNKELSEKLENKEHTILELTSQLSKVSANHAFLSEKLETQKAEFEELQKTAHLQFEKIANKLFEEKSSKFTETNKANIETLLNPLKEDINKFKTKVEETYDKESKQRFSLEEKVKDLIEQTNKVSAEANNLATALKGKPQKRGNWGEMILERILESSGLTKDREYFIQQSMKDEDGNTLRPDVKVILPDERVIIIDSKVSLVAYDKFVATDNPDEQKMFLDEHINSVINHINQLSSKKYDDLDSSLDFTMMFIPIEPAYFTALQGDTDLWAFAYSKRILLVSPTNLIACLKLISDLWRREWQNKNAMEIVKRGEALYEKIVGFTKTFEEIGNSIRASQEKYDKALGQLKEGKGNVISQANQLRNLGLKSEKKISLNMLPTEEEEEE